MAVAEQRIGSGAVRGIRGWAIVAGLLLVLAGMVAISSPYLAALVVTLWVAWGLLFGGVAEWISAFSSDENRLWKVVLGLLYFAVGIYMLRFPGSGLAALALTLAWLFLLQGIVSIFGALQLRPVPGWGWWLLDGIVTVLLAFLIFSGWPGSSARIVALLAGISLIMSGATRLALAFAR